MFVHSPILSRRLLYSLSLQVAALLNREQVMNGSETKFFFFFYSPASHSPLKSDFINLRETIYILGCPYAVDREGLSCQDWPIQHETSHIFIMKNKTPLIWLANLLQVALPLRKLCQLCWDFQIFTALELTAKRKIGFKRIQNHH